MRVCIGVRCVPWQKLDFFIPFRLPRKWISLQLFIAEAFN